MSWYEWIVAIWLGCSAGALVMFTWAYARTRSWERKAQRDRAALARLHGQTAGRVMRQMGQRCPPAVHGKDEDATHRNAMVVGWHEANDEIEEAERWIVAEAETITREAAG